MGRFSQALIEDFQQDSTRVDVPVVHLPAVKDSHPATAAQNIVCLLYTSPSPRDATLSRMPSSA